jgi:hypothetical protein
VTLSNIILAEKNKLNQTGVWPWLLALTPAGSGTTYRYTNNTAAVSYGGQTYAALPFRIEPIDKSGDGQLQAVQIIVTDIGLTLQSVIRAYNGLRRASVTLTQVNTGLLTEDFSGDSVTFQVSHCQNKYTDIVIYCGVPGSLKHRVPEDEYFALQCRHDFRIPSGAYSSRCGYTPKTIVAVNIGVPGRVSVEVTNHGFVTDDTVALFTVNGITPSLAGDWTIEKFNDNVFKVNDTDGLDYSGSYTSGGLAGYAKCPRLLTTCCNYGRNTNYGGIAASRADAIRLAL